MVIFLRHRKFTHEVSKIQFLTFSVTEAALYHFFADRVDRYRKSVKHRQNYSEMNCFNMTKTESTMINSRCLVTLFVSQKVSGVGVKKSYVGFINLCLK